MLKKIVIFICIFNCSIKAYILKVKDLITNKEIFYDVGAFDKMTGFEIVRLLTSELNISANNLIVYRPDDYKVEFKDRLLQDTDVIHVIDQTSKEPIGFRRK